MIFGDDDMIFGVVWTRKSVDERILLFNGIPAMEVVVVAVMMLVGGV